MEVYVLFYGERIWAIFRIEEEAQAAKKDLEADPLLRAHTFKVEEWWTR